MPIEAERQGIDTKAYAGDTLTVTHNAKIAAVLAWYSLPNNPTGTSRQIQFSVKLLY